MTERALRTGGWARGLPVALAVLLMLGGVMRARAAEPELPSKDFLEYLGTLEAEDGDWTIFDAIGAPTGQRDSPSPPQKEKAPAPQPEDEP